MEYRKHYFPLESNPDVFTDLIHRLGVGRDLEFQDVLSLDDHTLLPPTTLAVILILPTSNAFELRKAAEDADIEEYKGRSGVGQVVWFKQTINNACGLYAILHALCNSEAADMIQQDSILGRLLRDSKAMEPNQRARMLESSEEVELAYNQASAKSQSATPARAEAEVDFHYICFVQFDQHLLELDGDRKGPLDRGPSEPSMLREDILTLVRKYVRMEPDNLSVNAMALVRNDSL